MSNQVVVIEETFNAPVEKVWQALTDKDKMKQWYFKLDDFKAEKGFKFSFPGQGRKGEQYIHLCEVTIVKPMKQLQYSWQYKDYEGYSTVTFELFAEGDKTRLKLTHEGLDSFPAHPDFAVDSFRGGWTHLMTISLKEYLAKEN
ncbi:SRPBCC domain-containing protein [Chitinophaga sp.]|uniref:SRPBCC family protein n=1 Tax=Chitinophaga sp. TaxID=1869181 RepID=UPI0031DC202D